MAKERSIISIGLWYDHEAEEAANFYKGIFPGSTIDKVTRYGNEGQETHGGKPGSVMLVVFTLAGLRFQAINGGPLFKKNPSISFYVVMETEEETDNTWNKLAEGGTILMPLEKQPWSAKYGWVQDKYGLTWQIGIGKFSDVGQKITPFLMYTGKQAGRADEAMKFYMSIFKGSSIDGVLKRQKGQENEGHIEHAQFKLADSKFMVMDSTADHKFNFNEATSIIIDCEDQKEIDYYWNSFISGGGQESMCGWLADKFGVSWQVNAVRLNEMLADKDQKKVDRVTKAFLKMRKFDLAALEKAFAR